MTRFVDEYGEGFRRRHVFLEHDPATIGKTLGRHVVSVLKRDPQVRDMLDQASKVDGYIPLDYGTTEARHVSLLLREHMHKPKAPENSIGTMRLSHYSERIRRLGLLFTGDYRRDDPDSLFALANKSAERFPCIEACHTTRVWTLRST